MAQKDLSLEDTLARCHILYIADHGGGNPPQLEYLTQKERLAYMRSLGFRVREFFDIGSSSFEEKTDWVRFTNDMAMCMDNGFVNRLPKEKR